MNSLPDELHVRILSFLDPDANCHLVSRRYVEIGAPIVFESFQFHPTDAALERMKNIAGSKLARYVTCLEFEGEVEGEYDHLISYEDTIPSRARCEQAEYDARVFAAKLKEQEREAQIEAVAVRDAKTFHDMVIGFSCAGRPIAELVALNVRQAFESDPEFKEACKSLTYLHLHINADNEDPGLLDRLEYFVKDLAHLEDLALIIGEHDGWYTRSVELHNITPQESPIWTQLRTVELGHFGFIVDDLIEMLRCL